MTAQKRRTIPSCLTTKSGPPSINYMITWNSFTKLSVAKNFHHDWNQWKRKQWKRRGQDRNWHCQAGPRPDAKGWCDRESSTTRLTEIYPLLLGSSSAIRNALLRNDLVSLGIRVDNNWTSEKGLWCTGSAGISSRIILSHISFISGDLGWADELRMSR